MGGWGTTLQCSLQPERNKTPITYFTNTMRFVSTKLPARI
jgi:hypothetical protein